MKNQGRYRHLRVDWVGESSSESITLCGVEGEDIGAGQTLCPDCAQVADALHVCGLGPESLRFFHRPVIQPGEDFPDGNQAVFALLHGFIFPTDLSSLNLP